MPEEAYCPYCGGTLDTESELSFFQGRDDIKYACNMTNCVATVWTEEGWLQEQRPGSMMAGYL